jgi:hypothetical protein
MTTHWNVTRVIDTTCINVLGRRIAWVGHSYMQYLLPIQNARTWNISSLQGATAAFNTMLNRAEASPSRLHRPYQSDIAPMINNSLISTLIHFYLYQNCHAQGHNDSSPSSQYVPLHEHTLQAIQVLASHIASAYFHSLFISSDITDARNAMHQLVEPLFEFLRQAFVNYGIIMHNSTACFPRVCIVHLQRSNRGQ